MTRHFFLGAAYGLAAGMFARALIEAADRAAHAAKPKKVRP